MTNNTPWTPVKRPSKAYMKKSIGSLLHTRPAAMLPLEDLNMLLEDNFDFHLNETILTLRLQELGYKTHKIELETMEPYVNAGFFNLENPETQVDDLYSKTETGYYENLSFVTVVIHAWVSDEHAVKVMNSSRFLEDIEMQKKRLWNEINGWYDGEGLPHCNRCKRIRRRQRMQKHGVSKKSKLAQ